MDAPHNELMSALATLLEAGKYSDLTIVCGERRWAVHRAVICSRSGFFDGACSNRFREAETGIIDLSEDEEDAVEHMIKCTTCSTIYMSEALAHITARFLPPRLPGQISSVISACTRSAQPFPKKISQAQSRSRRGPAVGASRKYHYSVARNTIDTTRRGCQPV